MLRRSYQDCIHPCHISRWIGRAPQTDDFVVPRPPQCRRKFGPSRDKNYVRKRLLEDLDTLDLRARRTHDLRRSFISHAQQDGADRNKLIRLTNPSEKKATAFAGYTEFSWIDFCTEVAKLNVAIPKPAYAPAQPLSLTVGQSESASAQTTTPTTPRHTRPQLATVPVTPKEKAPENPGLGQWRRRESNPPRPPLPTTRHCVLSRRSGGDSGGFGWRRFLLGSTGV